MPTPLRFLLADVADIPDDDLIPTSVAARMLGVKPPTLRHGLCTQGHYLGLVPVKLPSGRLLWNVPAIRALRGEAT